MIDMITLYAIKNRKKNNCPLILIIEQLLTMIDYMM